MSMALSKQDPPNATPGSPGQRPPEDAVPGTVDLEQAWGGTIVPEVLKDAQATQTEQHGGRRPGDPLSGGVPPDSDVHEPTAKADPTHGQRPPDTDVEEPTAQFGETEANRGTTAAKARRAAPELEEKKHGEPQGGGIERPESPEPQSAAEGDVRGGNPHDTGKAGGKASGGASKK